MKMGYRVPSAEYRVATPVGGATPSVHSSLWMRLHSRAPLLVSSGTAFLGTTLTGILGFVFWVIAARLYPASSVGLASAAISAMFLVGNLGRLGMDYALALHLPQQGNKERRHTTALVTLGLVGIASAAFGLLFILQGAFSSEVRNMLVENGWLAVGFVLACGAWGLGLVLEQLLLVGRYGGLVLGKNAAFSVGRIVALVILLPLAGERYGIVAATLLGVGAGVAVVWAAFRTRMAYSFGSMRESVGEVARLVGSSGFGNYVPALVAGLPGWLLPVTVLDRADSASAAHFYTAWMIVTLVNSAPAALASGMLAEGSRVRESSRALILKAYKYAAVVMVPAVAVLFVAAEPILSIFGSGYSESGAELLHWMALGSIPYALVQVNAIKLRLDGKLGALVVAAALLSSICLGGSYFAIPVFGLESVGIAWMAGSVLAGIVSIWPLLPTIFTRGEKTQWLQA